MKNKNLLNTDASLGIRSIKTAIACTLCALIYLPFGRSPAFACICAIFGTGSDLEESVLYGGNRFFGTIIGGIIGVILFRVYVLFCPDGDFKLLLLPFLFVGVLILIYACQLFKWNGGVQPGGVVLCIVLFNTPISTYISYTLNRIIDTGFGYGIALIVALLLPKHRVISILKRLKLLK